MPRFAALLAVTLVWGVSASAQAQAVYAPRTVGRNSSAPAVQRPTISPYLNLFRPNVGPVGNYQTLVRPQLNQQANNVRQAQAIQATQRSVERVERQVQTGGATGPISPTGHSSSFMNYSHFYSVGPSGRR